MKGFGCSRPSLLTCSFPTHEQIEKSKTCLQDLVTSMDVKCEGVIRACVARHFSDHSFLGEEGVAPGRAPSQAALKSALEAAEWCVVCVCVRACVSLSLGVCGCILGYVCACLAVNNAPV